MQKVPPPDDGKVLNMLPTRKETSMCLYSQLSIYLAVYLSIDRSIYLCTYLSIHPSIHLFIYPSIHLSVYLYIHPSLSLSPSLPPSIHPSTYSAIHLSIYPSICLSLSGSLSLSRSLPPSLHPSIHPRNLSVYLSVCLCTGKLDNEAILQGFLHFRQWQHEKWSNSARLPPCSMVENAASLRDFLNVWTWQRQKRKNSARLPSRMESWMQSWRACTNAFCDCSTPSV